MVQQTHYALKQKGSVQLTPMLYKGRKFSDEVYDYIRMNWPTTDASVIGAKLNLTESQVNGIASRLAIRKQREEAPRPRMVLQVRGSEYRLELLDLGDQTQIEARAWLLRLHEVSPTELYAMFLIIPSKANT